MGRERCVCPLSQFWKQTWYRGSWWWNLFLANFTFSSDHWKGKSKTAISLSELIQVLWGSYFCPQDLHGTHQGIWKKKHKISSHLGLGDDLGIHSWQASSKRKGELKHVGPNMLGFQLPLLQTGRGKIVLQSLLSQTLMEKRKDSL